MLRVQEAMQTYGVARLEELPAAEIAVVSGRLDEVKLLEGAAESARERLLAQV